MPSSKAETPVKPEDVDTPPSSPPSDGHESDSKSDYGLSETMRAEEEKMRQKSERDEAQRQERLEAERKKDLQGGSGAVDGKFKALEYLLSQSKVRRTDTPSLVGTSPDVR